MGHFFLGWGSIVVGGGGCIGVWEPPSGESGCVVLNCPDDSCQSMIRDIGIIRYRRHPVHMFLYCQRYTMFGLPLSPTAEIPGTSEAYNTETQLPIANLGKLAPSNTSTAHRDQPLRSLKTFNFFNADIECSPFVIAIPATSPICPPLSGTWVCAN